MANGTTRDERTQSAARYDGQVPITERICDEVLTETFSTDRPAVEAEYPRASYGSAAEAWAAIMTDRKWTCTQYGTPRKLARYTPFYQYEFADPAPPPMWAGPPPMLMGAYHTSDVWSLFDLGGMPSPFTPEQQRLADQIIDYWTSFAGFGDPAEAGGTDWPRFRADGNPPHTQALAPGGIGPVDLAAEHHCDFWAGR
ncbi:carboxylesterase family protein [Saccharopolyspora sp. NPDC050389]|uniref:carboxylesterase family protein n=1 Tax=Saccharopolyspora sp. NPDC050389 TaxID=3155516 RepID=UPI0034099F42